MNVVCDIEANSLDNPSKIWVIVCKDIDTGEYHVFREPTQDKAEMERFLAFASGVHRFIGHHFLGYDYPVLNRLLGISSAVSNVTDTLIVSKLVDYSRPNGHSIEQYGLEFGLEKIPFNDWTKYSKDMETYCIRDVDICHKVYLKYLKVIQDPSWKQSLDLEHKFQLCVNSLRDNGFSFNTKKAHSLLEKVTKELGELDAQITEAFPPRLVMEREVHPKYTRYGTLHRGDFRWVRGGDLSEFNGGPFCKCRWQSFNGSSHKQIIRILSEANWSPTDKTQTHTETEREINRRKYRADKGLDLEELRAKLEHLGKYGWKINENNLSTLPSSAPKPARLLARRILLESRRRTLTEWLGLLQEDGRIHGQFQGIGAWTHRMAHQRPNTANIPNDLDTQGKTKLLGKEMRSLWQAPKNRLLIGVDAEGIQLRIFAHYIDDKEFTNALVNGRKEDKTDPHSLNQRILGPVCKSRAAAKRFIYALLLGAGLKKLSSILECNDVECQEALDRLLQRYKGWQVLKNKDIPRDASRSYFIGLDGRKVRLPGETKSERSHLAMSGYLQNGEAVVMKMATLKWWEKLHEDKALLVNFVHDEWQTEVPNNMEVAVRIAKIQAASLEDVGRELKLKCPLAGSYWNDDHKDYTIGTNWSVTH